MVDDAKRSGWATARTLFDILATIAIIAVAGILGYQTLSRRPAPPVRGELKVPREPLSLEGAGIVGSQSASVILLEFSDFECPFCGRFAKTVWPTVREKYVDTGRVQLAFRHLPLPIHAHSRSAAIAASCAAEQGRFLAFHDLLFANSKSLDDKSLEQYAEQAGVASSSYLSCVRTSGDQRVQADVEIAKSLGLNGTPAFFVGTREHDGKLRVQLALQGARPLSEFVAALDRMIRE